MILAVSRRGFASLIPSCRYEFLSSALILCMHSLGVLARASHAYLCRHFPRHLSALRFLVSSSLRFVASFLVTAALPFLPWVFSADLLL